MQEVPSFLGTELVVSLPCVCVYIGGTVYSRESLHRGASLAQLLRLPGQGAKQRQVHPLRSNLESLKPPDFSVFGLFLLPAIVPTWLTQVTERVISKR